MTFKRTFLTACLLLPLILGAAADTLNVTITIHRVSGLETELPEEFRLHAPYPNPFNPSVTIDMDLPIAEIVDIRVYDLTGRTAGVIYQGYLQLGFYSWVWNPENLASGIYILHVRAGDRFWQKKMVYLK